VGSCGSDLFHSHSQSSLTFGGGSRGRGYTVNMALRLITENFDGVKPDVFWKQAITGSDSREVSGSQRVVYGHGAAQQTSENIQQ